MDRQSSSYRYMWAVVAIGAAVVSLAVLRRPAAELERFR